MLVLLDIYPAREEPIPGVTSDLIKQAAHHAGLYEIYSTTGPNKLPTLLATMLRDGDIVLTIGAGSITEAAPVILNEMAKVQNLELVPEGTKLTMMNEFEQDDEMIPDQDSAEISDVASGSESSTEEAIAVEPETEPVPVKRSSKRTKQRERPTKGRAREGKNSRPALSRRMGVFRRVVFISWSGEREPATELLWAEAVIEGEWVVIETLEKVRTRKEVLERILALDSALVALDFNLVTPLNS